MNPLFNKICKMSQKQVKKYVQQELSKTHSDIRVGDGYVYAQGKFPVLLVAHMDTVHKELPTVIFYNKKKKSVYSPYGIGGDDRCGIYMILEIVKRYNCSVLFCEDEEIGGVGAKKFTQSEDAKGLKFNYMIEFDRCGKNDAVFYWCDNKDFEKFITKEFYSTARGSFSDISTLAPHFGCAAVNLSCGYYGAHTKKEYVVLPQMYKSMEAAMQILERTTERDKFEYIEAKYSYYSYYDGNYYDEFYYLVEYVDEANKTYGTSYYDTWAYSKYEAICFFLANHPNKSRDDIIEVVRVY